MKNLIIAGATGYLGSHLLKELQMRNMPFKAVARNVKKLQQMGLKEAEIIQAEVTKPASLKGKMEGADVIISTVGITRQKDGLSYLDVDYQANFNLLQEAKRAGIKKFIYISAINGEQMRHLKIMAAKEKFVDALKASGMNYLVVRPNGFFSDLKDFLEMAKRGTVYLFGHGEYKLNPIHGADLACVILDAIDKPQNESIVGGPEVLSQNQIAEFALEAYKKPVKILHLPDWLRKFTISTLRLFTPVRIYGPFEFFLTMMGQDNVGPCYGDIRMKTFFEEEVRSNLAVV